MFKLVSDYKPAGDQPQAIDKLVSGLNEKKRAQVLLGITGSGKTYTMANIVASVQRPTLVLAHNKTLAAQLYEEFKTFFPSNAVEYFVSYYDYYQPEAYIPRTDTYIEKDMAINDQIDRLRLSATKSLLERNDVLIVASVSCIYGLGMPEYYAKMLFKMEVGQVIRRDDLLLRLVDMAYTRNDMDLGRGNFRARGDVIEIIPSYEDSIALRIEFFGDTIERLSMVDPLTGKVLSRHDHLVLYPGSHYVTPEEIRWSAIQSIQAELKERQDQLDPLYKQRLIERTKYDVEMIREIGTCKGIENYSRHFSGRAPGDAPSCLLDYFPKDFLLFIDESHQTVPQVHAMYNGDRARKQSLVEYGFRLPSAFDNRPLKFHEFYDKINQVIYVSATPGTFEVNDSGGNVVEQIIRPTGLLDPEITVKPASSQVDDVLNEIRIEVGKGRRVLVTTLTKRLSEELTQFLLELGVKAKYLHSDIDTIERMEILRDLRRGGFDVLVGINLLREGLDIPEVSLVAILDADKEGFLRSETSLIQTCGRASRNAEGRVILYADKQTKAIDTTIATVSKRRATQAAYNAAHGITPKTVIRAIGEGFGPGGEPVKPTIDKALAAHMSASDITKKIKALERDMHKAAKEWRFEEAAALRDQIRELTTLLLT